MTFRLLGSLFGIRDRFSVYGIASCLMRSLLVLRDRFSVYGIDLRPMGSLIGILLKSKLKAILTLVGLHIILESIYASPSDKPIAKQMCDRC
ncbi:hypothetical protein M0802_014608 [Mischocyttarus mexicanus]|nr:hypothetical protein M0802_014608 [Mischocyttarus mexicanus]